MIDLETDSDVSDFVRNTDPDTYYILGRGSNTLINPNSKIRTIVRIAPELAAPEIDGSLLRLSAGTPMKKMQDIAQINGLSGLEFAAGVPASLGGMVAMNFGCWGHNMSDRVTRVRIADDQGHIRWIDAESAEFAYRSSIFQHRKWIVLQAELRMTPADPNEIKAAVLTNIQTRVEKQPLRDKTFGSIFKNPPGDYAARLLEFAGLKGQRWGDIQLSDRHANFLLNLGNATYDEAVQVITMLMETVQEKTGVQLEKEVKWIS